VDFSKKILGKVMAKITVIIPTYNRANLVARSIESVLSQTYQDWELIVVDDGSQDETKEVVSRFTDPRIHYIFQENKKLPGARNTGIRASTGEYLVFLDSDDQISADKLALQSAVLDANSQIGLVCSGWYEVDLEGRVIKETRPWLTNPNLNIEDWLSNNPFIPPAVMVRRQFVIDVGLFDEQQFYVEDWDLWLRLSHADCQMAWVPGIVCFHTCHEGNMGRQAVQMSSGLFRLMDKFFAQKDLDNSLRQLEDKTLANAHLDAAIRYLAADNLNEACYHLKECIKRNPQLLEGTPPRVMESLASSALSVLVIDREKYIGALKSILGEVSPHFVYSTRQLLAMVEAAEAFETYSFGQRYQAKRHVIKTLALDVQWIRNRGLLGILLKP
jgi:glycosyltransferase involved in cell wall biosynthesis